MKGEPPRNTARIDDGGVIPVGDGRTVYRTNPDKWGIVCYLSGSTAIACVRP